MARINLKSLILGLVLGLGSKVLLSQVKFIQPFDGFDFKGSLWGEQERPYSEFIAKARELEQKVSPVFVELLERVREVVVSENLKRIIHVGAFGLNPFKYCQANPREFLSRKDMGDSPLESEAFAYIQAKIKRHIDLHQEIVNALQEISLDQACVLTEYSLAVAKVYLMIYKYEILKLSLIGHKSKSKALDFSKGIEGYLQIFGKSNLYDCVIKYLAVNVIKMTAMIALKTTKIHSKVLAEKAAIEKASAKEREEARFKLNRITVREALSIDYTCTKECPLCLQEVCNSQLLLPFQCKGSLEALFSHAICQQCFTKMGTINPTLVCPSCRAEIE